MSDKSSTDIDSLKNQKSDDNKAAKGASDFVVGSVTFVIFIMFMTAWMYFQSE